MSSKIPKSLVQRRSWSQRALLLLVGLNRDHITQFLICIFITGFGVLVFFSNILGRFETIFLDSLFSWKPTAAALDHIIYVEVAEDSLFEIKERPWPRKYHAEILKILKEWGARAVLFNYIFEGKINPVEDEAFAAALKKNKGVYLPALVSTVGGKKVLIRSIPEFEDAVQGVGHINIAPDSDGIVRRFKPFIEAEGKLYPHLGLKLVYDMLGRPIAKEKDLWSKPDEDGSLMISWPGTWKEAFKHYSYVDVLRSYERLAKKERPFVQPGDFRDKIVLIGETAGNRTQLVATPLDKTYPSLGVIASIINGALINDFVHPATPKQNLLFLIGIGLISIAFFTPFRNISSLIAAVLLIGGWIAFVFFMFTVKSFWIFIFQPALLIFAIFIFCALYSKVASDRERLLFYKLSTTDGLTGVSVRRYFDLMFVRAFKTAKRFHLPLSVVLIDIDHFKRINDTYGHQAGDEVLQKVAALIQKGIRFHGEKAGGDLLARYGGEEFVLLLPNTDLKTATFNVAERIRKAVETIPIEWNEHRINLTISLGVVSVRDTDEVPELIIQRADEALYRSKEAGRNRTSIESFE